MRWLLLLCACGRVDFAIAPDAKTEGPIVYALDTAPQNGRIAASDPAYDGFCLPASCPTEVAGMHGNANEFATSQAIYVGRSELVGTAPYSVAVWFRHTDALLGTFVAKPAGYQATSNPFSLFIDAIGKVTFETVTSANVSRVTVASSAILDAGWHHAAATYDGTTKRLYVDGQLSGAETQTDAFDAVQPIYFGSDLDDGGLHGPLTGDLDDIRFYASVLSDDEVAALAK